ncbi:MAG: sigma-54-dependent transcriptional regulator [Akkermansiaceae bacterium]
MSSDSDHQLLLVDPDHDYLEWATKHLAADGVKILRCDGAEKAAKVVAKTTIDLVICDLKLEPFDGIELIQKIRSISPGTVAVLTAVFPTTTQIVEATQKGAHDVLRKESLSFELRQVVESALQTIDQRRSLGPSQEERPGLISKTTIIGISRPLQNVMKIVGRVAQSEAPVLVTGESGTGKELIARSIHDYSPRRKKEILVINCGAIPENLLESELFGHEKGSFTGAISKRSGRFEDCHESTLFLDEVGDLPPSVQVKLLRVLQDGTFSRVGSNEVLSTDVRIVTATNKNLAAEVTAGRFREDLYYRLNVVEIQLPPLRERPEDIPILAEFFLDRLARKQGSARMRLTGEAVEHLQKHNWPGNVRELENTMARACALATTDILLPEDIPIGSGPTNHLGNLDDALSVITDSAQREGQNALIFARDELIRHALELSGEDPKEAAKALGVSLSTLKKWLPTGSDV